MVDVGTVMSGWGGTVMAAAMALAIMLIIGMVGFSLLWAHLHNIRIRIHALTGSKTLVVKTYKAREVKKEGTTILKPFNPFDKWLTIEIKPPNQPGTWYYEKNKKTLNVFKTGNGSYVYIKFEKQKDQQPRYGIVDEDMKAWVAMQLRQTEQKYANPGFMEKYGLLFGYGGLGVFYLLGLLFMMNG